MPVSSSTLLGKLLASYLFTLSGGYARSANEVFWFLTILATIELTVAAGAWIMSRSGFMADLFWKVLGFAFLFWLVEQWPVLTKGLREGFIEWGLLVGGSVLSSNDITDPGNLVDFGFSVTALLFNKLSKLSLLTNGFVVIVGGLSGQLIVLFYIGMAAHLFKAILEYYIASACLFFLLPFLAFQKTAPLAERVFGTFIAHAVRLLIYAAILSASLPVLYDYKLPNDPGMADVGHLLAVAFVMFSVMLSAPAMAHGLILGTPVLSMSTLLHGGASMLQTAAAVGAVGTAASIAGGAALRAGLSGASAMRAAAHMGQASYRATHPFTHASPSGRVATSLVGGAQGMATYSMQRLTSGFRAAVQQGRTRANRTMQP